MTHDIFDLVVRVLNTLAGMTARDAHPAMQNSFVFGVVNGLSTGLFRFERANGGLEEDLLEDLCDPGLPLTEVLKRINKGISERNSFTFSEYLAPGYRTGIFKDNHADGLTLGYTYVYKLAEALGPDSKTAVIKRIKVLRDRLLSV